ncbi:MAG: hypothetical protein ACR2PV_06055 [Gammaproteobacteria bacterium]
MAGAAKDDIAAAAIGRVMYESVRVMVNHHFWLFIKVACCWHFFMAFIHTLLRRAAWRGV